jgi:hypothetical protein
MNLFEWFKRNFGGEPKYGLPEPKQTGEMVVVDMEAGTQTPVKDTDSGKLWLKIATNHCPVCNHKGFYQGPSGGMSTNIICAYELCQARFNVTPVIGIAERI